MARGRRGVGPGMLDLAVRHKAADLERAERGQLAIARLDPWRVLGEQSRGQRKVAVRSKAEIIRQAELEPVRMRETDVGDQRAGRSALGLGVDREDRQQRQSNPEQVEAAAAKADPPGLGVLDDLGRGDRPAWGARAAFRIDHRATRIDSVLEHGLIAGSGRAIGGDAPAAVEHDQQIFDRPVAQIVGEHDVVADHPIAFGR